MRPPPAEALRLVARSRAGKAPAPPRGLATWTPTAEALAVLLDAGGDEDPRTTAGVVAQLPKASTLPSGTLVFVLGKAAPARSLWRPFAREVPIPRASRCAALLARGYVDIGAADVRGHDLAWGHTP